MDALQHVEPHQSAPFHRDPHLRRARIKAHSRSYHSTLGSREIKKKKKIRNWPHPH